MIAHDRTIASHRRRNARCASPASPLPAHADAVADFYKGKQISLIIGTSAGNDYDFRGRLLARHMGRHIPGEPTIVPRNMPGAGGINAANWLANVAPHDGTAIHLIMTNMMAKQAIGVPGIKFDARKFSWIGNTTSTPNVTNSWHTSGVTKIEQAKDARADHRRPGRHRRRRLWHGDERAGRHQVQGRHRLSRRQRGQPRDGARRDPRPRLELLGVVEIDQAGLGAREEDHHAGAGRAQARSRPAGHADADRARQQRPRPQVHDVPVGGDRGRARAGHAARRAGGPPQRAAPRLRRDREGPAVPGRGRQVAAWTSSR